MRLLFLLTAIAFLVQGAPSDDRAERVKKYRDECIAETKVSPDLIDGDFVDDNNKVKCFAKCFYHKAGLVTDEGEILLDVVKSKLPKDNKDALAVLEKCKDEKGGDPCETVYLVHRCYFEHMPKDTAEKD